MLRSGEISRYDVDEISEHDLMRMGDVFSISKKMSVLMQIQERASELDHSRTIEFGWSVRILNRM